MKQLTCAILICLLALSCAVGQEIKIERAENNLTISPYLCHSVRELTDSSHIAIKIIEMHSAIAVHPEDAGSEVLVSDLLCMVKERFDDGTPEGSVIFWIRGLFYNPRDFTLQTAERSILFRHGTVNNAKTTTLLVSSNEITVK